MLPPLLTWISVQYPVIYFSLIMRISTSFLQERNLLTALLKAKWSLSIPNRCQPICNGVRRPSYHRLHYLKGSLPPIGHHYELHLLYIYKLHQNTWIKTFDISWKIITHSLTVPNTITGKAWSPFLAAAYSFYLFANQFEFRIPKNRPKFILKHSSISYITICNCFRRGNL